MFSSSSGMNQEEACHREGHGDLGWGEPTEEEWVCLLLCSQREGDRCQTAPLSFIRKKKKRRKRKRKLRTMQISKQKMQVSKRLMEVQEQIRFLQDFLKHYPCSKMKLQPLFSNLLNTCELRREQMDKKQISGCQGLGTGEGWEVRAKEYSDKNILYLIVVIVAQLCGYTKSR